MEESFSVKRFAEIAEVSEQTVYRWINSGVLVTVQIVPHGPHRIPKSEAVRVLSVKAPQ